AKTAAMSPTLRQTVSWLAVYTGLLAVGVWGYVLVRGPEKPLTPTSEPTPFLKPGEDPPAPKAHAKADAGGQGGKDEGHGSSGHGHDAHGPAKKTEKNADSHGKAAKASDKKKPAGKKDAKKNAGGGGGHH
ncbi:MAG: hypothetical protein ACK4WH_10350, partial [Phycisphaerales bacterium]